MKKQVLYVVLFFCCSFIFSCDEIGPAINLHEGGGTVDSAQRNVLIENFTGVQCVNCPQGDTILGNLVNQYPGKIEVIDIHAGVLAVPLHPTDPDFRTSFGDQLNNYIGPFPFQPSAAIDRKLYEISPGDFERIVGRTYWPAYVQQELDSSAIISVSAAKSFDDASRLLTVTMNVRFLSDVTADINASIAITENNIIAPQLNQAATISGYIHNNVLRTMMTPYNGVIIDGSKTAGTSWSKQFTMTLSNDWNLDNCRIIAFVSKSTGTYDVLQVTGTSIK